MATRLKKLIVDRVDLVDKGANPDAEIALFKRDTDPKAESLTPTKEAPVADDTTVDVEALAAERDALQAELDALTEMSDEDLAALRGLELAKSDTPPSIDDTSLPEDVRKALVEADELRVRVAKMERDARLALFVRKAADDYASLAPADELGPALEEIDRVAPDAAQTLDRLLKAVAARAETSDLFKELGTTSSGKSDADSKFAALVAKAQEAGASRADAMEKVLKEHGHELFQPAKNA